MSTPVNNPQQIANAQQYNGSWFKKNRHTMLGPGRYSQWRSRFLRYLDTKSNVAAHEEAETIHNMTTENELYFQAEKEAIFLILTGIGDEIYSTVDACNTAKEMWTAIERLQQGESLNVQDEVSPMQVNVQFLQQLQPEWSRFVTVVKQRQEIDTVSYHKLFDVLKQKWISTKRQKNPNAPSSMQSSSTRQVRLLTQRQRTPSQFTPTSSPSIEEDHEPDQH
ncbi:hypothetical protein Tco_0652208 [Tanacetum coccineum]|uniref:Gag protein n=1 Tax=Tanacetum coccineum TaxID=301880 RepID=A0ABQ4WWZ5_9ASTR